MSFYPIFASFLSRHACDLFIAGADAHVANKVGCLPVDFAQCYGTSPMKGMINYLIQQYTCTCTGNQDSTDLLDKQMRLQSKGIV